MAISLRANGTWINSTENVTPVIPAGAVAGDIMICSYGTKPFGDAPTINNGWTLIGSATDGTVAAGIDTGSMKTVVWYKIHTGTETNPTVTNTTNSVSSGRIDVYSCTSGVWVTPVGSGGGDATAGTGFSVTVSDVGWKAGDVSLVMVSLRSDAATMASGLVVTYNGLTSYGASTLGIISGYATATGQDMYGYFNQNLINTFVGTVSSVVISATLGAAHTGSTYMVRLRENSAPTVVLNTPSDGATAQSNTPTLSFTGTDFDSNAIEYNVQIDTVNTFDSIPLGFTLKSIAVKLYKVGNPTDNVSINLISDSINGTVLGTTGTLAGTTVTGTSTWYTFVLATPVILSATTKYYFSVNRSSVADGGNYYMISNKNTGNIYTLGGTYFSSSGVWGSEGTVSDLAFIIYDDTDTAIITQGLADTSSEIYGLGAASSERAGQSFTVNLNNPSLSFFSVTDLGFTAGHPFASGVQKSYTVQSALNDATTYYWRVRGVDPTGGNVYGAWSSVYSFTTIAGSPTYNESISISSVNSISAIFDAILVASITLSSDNLIVNTSIADLLAVANVSSVNQMTAINNLISEVSTTISQDSTISNVGGLDFNNVITLSSDNAIVPLLELVLNQSTSLGIDTQISENSNLDGVANVLLLSDNVIIPVTDLTINQNTSISIDAQVSEVGNIDVPVSTTLSSVNQLSSLLSLILETNATISSDHSISKSGNVDMVPTIAITQDSQISSATNLDAQNNIGLQTDNGIIGASSLIINSIAVLQSDSAIVNSNNVSMSEALNFTTDSSLLDNNIGSLVNDIVYLIDGQVSFTYDGFAEIVAQLIALSQLNISNTADILSQIELQIDNQVVFDLFMEAYSIINLSGETATTFDIISVINTVFDLNISSDILVEIASVINNNVTFSINAGIEAVDELSGSSSNTYFENTILNIIVSISYIDGLGIQIQGLKIIGALFLKNINTIK